jgi:xylulokinase
MPPPAFFMGIDVARTGLGLVVLSGDGKHVAHLRRAYGTHASLHDPQDWWRAARTGIKEILRRAELKADQIRCIGLSGDSDGLVMLGSDGRVLIPCSMGPDPRADGYVERLNRTVGARNLLNLAGSPAVAGSAAVKLLWLKENEKRVWHDAAMVLPPKDFLRFRLCGNLVTDSTDASATLLFNPKTRSWSKQLLAQLEINPAWLPAISSGQLISGRVTETAARESGLQSGTPVVTGGGHAAAVAVAAGVLNPGHVLIELGASAGLFAPTAEPMRDTSFRLSGSCHCLAGTWALSAPNLAGAESIDWLSDNIFISEVLHARRSGRDPLDPLTEQASEIAPGADNLIYLPQEHGRFAGFLGLKRHHGRGHLVRAALESGALAARLALDALQELKHPVKEILISGPGAHNTLWCQILADALDHPVHAAAAPECAATGASILASSAVGLYKTVQEACEHLIRSTTPFSPRKAATGVYQGLRNQLNEMLPKPMPPTGGTDIFLNPTAT